MRKLLCTAELAMKAKRLLDENGGFTIDEYGCTPEGDLWAVSKAGRERSFTSAATNWAGISLEDIARYLSANPILNDPSGVFFGGWIDEDGVTYLDHTLLFLHKHTAVHEAIRNNQKAIYNIGTRETLLLDGVSV